MSEILNAETRTEVQTILAELSGPVTLVHFTQANACRTCHDQRALLEELASLSDKLTLEVHDQVEDAALAQQYEVDKVPATILVGKEDHGIRYFGMNGGYEFRSLLDGILMVSANDSGLGEELEALVARIDEPVHLQVMITLTCPYCPKMVHVAHQMAFVNPLVRADMVDASEYPQLVQRYNVSGVPRTVINGVPGFEGALPAPNAIFEVIKAVNPALYRRLEEQMREDSGERLTTAVDPDHLYDSIIVGAGPAAMTATVYAARKSLDVAVLGKEVGGQIGYTETIENWPGVPSIGGQELSAMFRNHAERYPVAERLDVTVIAVVKTDDGFEVISDDGLRYRTRSIIYTAGKEYRRLGVPGEERFIGRGIAFCAICDAPLYNERSVAVIGGGNSAFTAARDLLNYASEIHLITRNEFHPDPSLYEQVSASRKISLHPNLKVREFLGADKLRGVRLESGDGSKRFDLAVDGVFLEVGLRPNSDPVAELVALNKQGEIKVGRDQSTDVAGFYAAGDVTDEQEKQIVVAAGAGAKAALALERYLQNHG